MWDNLMDAIAVLVVMIFVSVTLAWLVRTVLHHRQWLRASRTQNEFHNKLLDRFAGTNELLTYIQTPAGRRFLEAAPISLDAGAPERKIAAPINRILWSVQAGIVLVIGGFGFQFVSRSLIPEIGAMTYWVWMRAD